MAFIQGWVSFIPRVDGEAASPGEKCVQWGSTETCALFPLYGCLWAFSVEILGRVVRTSSSFLQKYSAFLISVLQKPFASVTSAVAHQSANAFIFASSYCYACSPTSIF